MQGRQFHQLGRQLGEFLGKTAAANSAFMLALPQQRARQQQFQNPEPRQITEDLLFNDPYCHHERNEVPAALRLAVQQLWRQEALLAQVARLKHAFRCQAETLTHGDFSCGSVFVAKTSLKVIDAEFAGFGPHGFDLGMMLGSLMLHYCAAAARPEAAAKEQQQYLLSQINQLLSSYQQTLFAELAQCRDLLLQSTASFNNSCCNRRFNWRLAWLAVKSSAAFTAPSRRPVCNNCRCNSELRRNCRHWHWVSA